MNTLLNYTLVKQIYDSPNSLVYQALRADNQTVILKQLKADYPTKAELIRYRREFDILSMLDLAGVVKVFDCQSYQNTLLLELEDFGGDSLTILNQKRRLSVAELLPLFIQVTDSLGQVHAADLIHKDINLNNIVCNTTTGQVKLIDFGIATRLPRENPLLKSPEQLEGTLAYISPEQTGRMNRALDYRTDLYSLGVTFYELLTGQLPFVSEDPLEVVHGHIAKHPVPAHEINPHVPRILSDVVMKLMAKNAEDRYQSAFGLKYDLERIQANLAGLEDLPGFELGQQDISGKFHLPQKLYGREPEIEILWQAFERISQGSAELLLIAGYSGIGKTALVQELYKPMTAKHGYFIAGKFDQFQRNVPYSAIVAAFRQLVQQLLTETMSQLARWQTQLKAALGTNGQVIVEVIPEMELIIGQQPPMPELGPTESQNRFNLVFQNFIRACCAKEHPLVIFLDDLQWADSVSLKLLTVMMNDIPHLLVLGTYRDNEVSPTHPLMTTLAEIQQTQVTLHTLTLSSLTLPYIKQFLADMLAVQEFEEIDPLAQLLLDKTGGNPFFLGEFVKTLYTENLLHFDYQQRRWQWDLAQIQARNITDNVVELMVEKIQQLSVSTQHVLTRAASLGNQFDLTTLSLIVDQSVKEVQHQLWEALVAGLVLTMDRNYRFVHDRVQQAAYSLISEGEKPTLHWQIGQILLTQTRVLEDRLFEMVDHLNLGLALATTATAKLQIAHLNAQVGQKAKSAAAYQAALKYLQTTVGLLPVNHWEVDYSFTLTSHEELIEVAFLNGDYAQVEHWAAVVLQNAATTLHCVKVYEIKILAKTAANQPTEALAIGLQVLAQLGIHLSLTPSEQEIQTALSDLTVAIPNQDIPSLIKLPLMTDPSALAALNILTKLVAPSFFTHPQLLVLIVIAQIQLALNYGNAPLSTFSYAIYGMVLVNVGKITRAYQYAQLALQMLTKFHTVSSKCQVIGSVGATLSFRQHLKKSIPLFVEACQSGLEIGGDLENVGYAMSNCCQFAYAIGQPLDVLERETIDYCDTLYRLKQSIPRNWLQALHLIICRLLETGSDIPSQETNLLASLQQANDKTGLFLFNYGRLTLYYLLGDYQTALTYAYQSKQYLTAVTGTAHVPIFYFYHSLCFLAGFEEAQHDMVLCTVAANQQELLLFVSHAPMNYQHKYDLVEAERARVLGHHWEAVAHYEKAIAGARENEYLQEDALAYELAAKFYLAQGMDKFAHTYFQEASYRYQRWGATAKVQHLQAQYPQFFGKQSSVTTPSLSYTQMRTTTSVSWTQELDLASILKASQALSSEIQLEKLLAKLMIILMENAGAQRGCLVLESHGQLLIEAEGMVGQDTPTVLQSQPIEQSQNLSVAILEYVARTKQSVVLNHATEEGNFTRDPYIVAQRPQSVLCTPLLKQGELTGILYLENNLTTGAFTAERVTLLNLLSSQAAISIKNAQLYQHTVTLNRAYQRFVPQQFLHLLDKLSIIEVELGDQVQLEMSVLFSDIRSFTTLSEKMSPADNFKFINAYLSRMQPVISQHHGFIDKYIGDAIMALFSGDADNAVQAGITMLYKLAEYNHHRQKSGDVPIQIGIGINTGLLMLGTVGGQERMDGTVISDAVNLASRVESMTKMYGATLLITEYTYSRLRDASQYAIREIDKVKVKGKTQPVTVYEVFDGDSAERIALKRNTSPTFERGLSCYRSQDFNAAITYFQQVLQIDADDKAAQLHLKRSEYFQHYGVVQDWEGIMTLESK